MHLDDQEKTAFMTEWGIFYYKVMLLGLKNASDTDLRLVNKMFLDMFNKTREVYINDMLVKSLIAEEHIACLEKSFEVLRK